MLLCHAVTRCCHGMQCAYDSTAQAVSLLSAFLRQVVSERFHSLSAGWTNSELQCWLQLGLAHPKGEPMQLTDLMGTLMAANVDMMRAEDFHACAELLGKAGKQVWHQVLLGGQGRGQRHCKCRKRH